METTILDKRVKPGMVFKGGSAGDVLSVVTFVDDEEMVRESGYTPEVTVGKLTEDEKMITSIHWAGFGWYKKGCFEFVRQMSDREFKKLMKK